MKRRLWALGLTLALGLIGVGGLSPRSWGHAGHEVLGELPAHFPFPRIPADNPLTFEKVALGRHLFYDKKLSINEQQSCGSCHQQALAFTDGKPRAVGTTGQMHARGSMGLTNVVYAARLAWANPLVERLEHQAMLPLFGEVPVELGMAGQETRLIERFQQDPLYPPLFEAAFPEEPSITLPKMLQAIASFERTLISSNSPYDRFVAGDTQALSPAAQRGLNLFMSERLECFHCHGGFNFSDNLEHEGLPTQRSPFHNTGLYDEDGKGKAPKGHEGVFEITGRARDMGRFKAPTLRNIAVTAPYMHDGSIATLEEVIAHYAAGGRAYADGSRSADQNMLKSEFVSGFVISAEEVGDVLAFLNSLTDEQFLTDPRFSDPFEAGTEKLGTEKLGTEKLGTDSRVK